MRQYEGHRQFMAKRDALFASQTHWIEIDLLRAGERPREVAGKSDSYYAQPLPAPPVRPADALWAAEQVRGRRTGDQ